MPLLLLPNHTYGVAELVRILNQTSGLKVEVSRPLGSQYVFVSDTNGPPKDLVKAIAVALSASLVEKDGTLTIRRTQSDIDQIRERRLKFRTRFIEKRFREFDQFRQVRGENDHPTGFANQSTRMHVQGDSYSENHNGRDLLPSHALLVALIRRMDIKQLAEIPTGDSVVYEDLRIPGSRRLPEYTDLLDEFRTRSQRWLKEMPQPNVSHPALIQAYRQGMFAGNLSHLRILVQASLTGLDFKFEGYDSNGVLKVFAQYGLFDSDEVTNVRSTKLDIGNEVKLFGPTGTAFLTKLYLPIALSTSTVPDWMLQPATSEPMNLFVSDALGMWATRRTANQRPLIVLVPDSFWSAAFSSSLVKPTGVNTFVARARLASTFQAQDVSGINVFRPVDAEYVEASTADRKQLAVFAQSCNSTRSFSLRKEAKLVAAACPQESSLVGTWLNPVSNNPSTDGIGQIQGDWSHHASRMLGKISDTHWDLLLRGSVFTAKELGIGQAMARYFLDDLELSVSGPSPVPELFSHPLEFLGDQGCDNVQISIEHSNVNYIQQCNAGQTPPSGLWQTEKDYIEQMSAAIPAWIYFKNKITRFISREEFEKRMNSSSDIRVGSKVQYAVVLTLRPGYTIRLKPTPNEVADTKLIHYTDLPKKFRDAIFERGDRLSYQAAEKNRDAMNQGTTNDNNSKPPPTPG